MRSRNILVGHSCMSTMVLSEVMSVPTWGRALATTTGRPAKATARVCCSAKLQKLHSISSYVESSACAHSLLHGMSSALMNVPQATNSSAQKPEKVPRSTYNIFVKESGPGLLAGRHTSSIGERGRILSEAWKQTSADERARCASAAATELLSS